MHYITRINCKKLPFVFLFTALLFGFLASVLLGVAALSGQFPRFNLVVQIAFGSLVVLPLFVSLIAMTAWFVRHRQQSRFFSRILNSHLVPIGFRPEISNLDNKWKMAEEVYQLEVDHWKIVLSQSRETSYHMEFAYIRNENRPNSAVEKVFQMTKNEIEASNSESLKSALVKNAFQ